MATNDDTHATGQGQYSTTDDLHTTGLKQVVRGRDATIRKLRAAVDVAVEAVMQHHTAMSLCSGSCNNNKAVRTSFDAVRENPITDSAYTAALRAAGGGA